MARGAYYQKLRAGLWRWLDPLRIVDPRSARDLNLSQEACLIFTPSRLHAPYLLQLRSGVNRIVVEKPCAVSIPELHQIGSSLDTGTHVYFSDSCLDVKCIPLLWFTGRLTESDWRFAFVEVGPLCLHPPGVQASGGDGDACVDGIQSRTRKGYSYSRYWELHARARANDTVDATNAERGGEDVRRFLEEDTRVRITH